MENQFIKVALKVLKETRKAMSASEIWEYIIEKNYDRDLNINGKTPWATLGAQLYTNEKSKKYFERVGARPIRFMLKDYVNNENIKDVIKNVQEKQLKKETNDNNLNFLEKQLHPILVYYLYNFMNIHAKTINHSKSNKKDYGEWVHPDIVGCYFPFEDWDNQVYKLNKSMSDSPVKLYSFELKRELNFSNLREHFFQAVSNSSWANEGYLVAAKIDPSEEFKYELKRLTMSYGIGVIQVDISNPDNTTILFPAKYKEDIDWETINKIASLKNDDFINFIECINDSIEISKVQINCFDKVKEIDELIVDKM